MEENLEESVVSAFGYCESIFAETMRSGNGKGSARMQGKSSGQRGNGFSDGKKAGNRAEWSFRSASRPSRIAFLVHRLLSALGARLKMVFSRLWPCTPRLAARLAIVERLAVGPKQSLLLIEVDGVRLVVAHSGESTPALMALPASIAFSKLPRGQKEGQARGRAKNTGGKRQKPASLASRTQASSISAGRIQ